MRNPPRRQARRQEHLHIYDSLGRCSACGRYEPRGFTKLEISMFIFIIAFMLWTIVVILVISHPPNWSLPW